MELGPWNKIQIWNVNFKYHRLETQREYKKLYGHQSIHSVAFFIRDGCLQDTDGLIIQKPHMDWEALDRKADW